MEMNNPSFPWICEKIDPVSRHVIPAKAGIQRFLGVTNQLDPGFHRGDGLNPIFSHLLTPNVAEDLRNG